MGSKELKKKKTKEYTSNSEDSILEDDFDEES